MPVAISKTEPYDANTIKSLSQKFGQSARVLTMSKEEAPNGISGAIIATWGKVELERFSGDAIGILVGSSPGGLLIDFIGDPQKSAKQGLPVYRLAGSAGYIFSASFDKAGLGHQRSLAVNAALLSAPAQPGPAQPGPAQPGPAQPVPAQTASAQQITHLISLAAAERKRKNHNGALRLSVHAARLGARLPPGAPAVFGGIGLNSLRQSPRRIGVLLSPVTRSG